MQTLNFDIYFTVPISHKIIPLHIMYGQKIIFDYLVMPWETGISKQISFSEEFDDEDIQISQIKIINNLNNSKIIMEILKINDKIKNIAHQIEENKNKIYLDTFLRTCNIDSTVLKIMGLPKTVTVSHSYLCNGNLYVPRCDYENSVISFNNEANTELNFSIEFFSTNINECLSHIDCNFKNGLIETNIKRPYQEKIIQLHKNLKLHYEEICKEEFVETADNLSQIVQFPVVEQHISKKEALLHNISTYSVIKIEGLPENINPNKHEIFYQNGAYYISNKNKKSYSYLLSKAEDDTTIIISYYNDNTFEPVLRNIFSHTQKGAKLQKIA